MIQQIKVNDEVLDLELGLDKFGGQIKLDDSSYEISRLADGKYVVTYNGNKYPVCCVVNENKIYADVDGVLFDLEVPSDDMGVAGGGDSSTGVKDKIFAPMPGKVVKVLVEEGQEIKAKQPMVIVEAMKMENQVNAAADGVVKKINFQDGDQVDTETPIIELELAE